MDSFEMNKIIGAVLGTILFVMGVGFLAEEIYAPHSSGTVGYALPMPEADGHGGGAEVEEVVVPIGVLLASASAESGAKVAKKCASCHNFDKGSANKTGPALFDIVGHGIAQNASFGYSDVLVEMGAAGDTWTYDSLNAFLEKPKTFAPGTKMSFAGLRSEKDRVNLLAYLQSLSEDPVPFPAVEEAMPAAEEQAEAAMEEKPAMEDAKPAMEEPKAAMEEAKPAMEEAKPAMEEPKAAMEEAKPAMEKSHDEMAPATEAPAAGH